MDEQNSRPNFDLSKLTPEQQYFFQAAGKYPASVTAQGIQLYLLCSRHDVDFEEVFDNVYAGRKQLISFTSGIHQQLAKKQPGLADLSSVEFSEEAFVGVLNAVVSITDVLADANKKGHPVSEEKLKEYLEIDYKKLREDRERLKKEAQALIDQAEEDEKSELKKMLQRALSQLEDTFNKKVIAEAEANNE